MRYWILLPICGCALLNTRISLTLKQAIETLKKEISQVRSCGLFQVTFIELFFFHLCLSHDTTWVSPVQDASLFSIIFFPWSLLHLSSCYILYETLENVSLSSPGLITMKCARPTDTHTRRTVVNLIGLQTAVKRSGYLWCQCGEWGSTLGCRSFMSEFLITFPFHTWLHCLHERQRSKEMHKSGITEDSTGDAMKWKVTKDWSK